MLKKILVVIVVCGFLGCSGDTPILNQGPSESDIRSSRAVGLLYGSVNTVSIGEPVISQGIRRRAGFESVPAGATVYPIRITYDGNRQDLVYFWKNSFNEWEMVQ